MANFDSGVASYILGTAEIVIGFPVDFKGNAEIARKHCKMFDKRTGRCWINQEVINYPDRFVGVNCPLERSIENEV